MAKDTHLLAIDLGEVLLSVDHHSTYRRLGELSNLPSQEVARRLANSPLEHKLDRGEFTPESFAAAVSAALNHTIDAETLRACWTGILGVKRDMAAWLEALLPQVTCVLVSNINWWHWQEATELLPLLRKFDAHVLSYVEGVRKPEAEYYRRVRERWPRERALFIDDRAENCAAATQHGFDAWQFSKLAPLARHVEEWLRSR
jgi:putative hydrolase of the HAD superfamily